LLDFDHTGSRPPLPRDTGTMRPGVGRLVTYTSHCPDDSEVYASQFPSGEAPPYAVAS
jgi:hypothetical protein